MIASRDSYNNLSNVLYVYHTKCRVFLLFVQGSVILVGWLVAACDKGFLLLIHESDKVRTIFLMMICR